LAKYISLLVLHEIIYNAAKNKHVYTLSFSKTFIKTLQKYNKYNGLQNRVYM